MGFRVNISCSHLCCCRKCLYGAPLHPHHIYPASCSIQQLGLVVACTGQKYFHKEGEPDLSARQIIIIIWAYETVWQPVTDQSSHNSASQHSNLGCLVALVDPVPGPLMSYRHGPAAEPPPRVFAPVAMFSDASGGRTAAPDLRPLLGDDKNFPGMSEFKVCPCCKIWPSLQLTGWTT